MVVIRVARTIVADGPLRAPAPVVVSTVCSPAGS
jgi:hypothetical protein